MLNIHTVGLKNFFSYGANPTIVNFDVPGTTLITGENLDDTGTNNGCGKTTLLQAMIYGLYDKTIHNITKDRLVNNINKKHMEVTVTFSRDGWFYHVVRARKMKAGPTGNYVKFFKKYGDRNFTEADECTRGADATNVDIEKALGIPFELFIRIVVFSALHVPFLDLPPRHPTQPCQSYFIEQLFGLVQITEEVESLKVKRKLDQADLDIKLAVIDQIEKQHKAHEQQLKSSRERIITWDVNKKNTLAKYRRELEELQSIDFEEQRLTVASLQQIKQLIADLKPDSQKTITAQNTAKKEVARLEKELQHLDNGECPYCKRDYHDVQLNHEIQKQCDLHKLKYIELTTQLQQEQEVLQGLIDEVASLSKTTKVTSLEALGRQQGQIDSLKQKIIDTEAEVNPYHQMVLELEQVEIDQVDFTEIALLQKIVLHDDFLIKLMSDKDSFMRKKILDKHLPFLNDRLQKHVTNLGLPHSVRFTHQLEVEITQFGNELDFGNLSHGQRSRVNFALSLSFRDMLQKLHSKVNICVLDEVLDVGLDSAGVHAAARLLKKMARDDKVGIFLISHRDELDGAFDRVLSVQMEKGFSYVNQERP